MPAKPSTIPDEILEQYRQLISTQSDIELKGASMPYTSVNGNMFSFLSAGGQLNLRFSKSDLTAFLEKHKAGQSVQHGVTMKEYAAVPDMLFNDIQVLAPYFAKSHSYAKGLKPKATTKKK